MDGSSKYDLVNPKGMELCHYIGCNRHKRLERLSPLDGARFCRTHRRLVYPIHQSITQMEEIPSEEKTYSQMVEEWYYRGQEISVRKDLQLQHLSNMHLLMDGKGNAICHYVGCSRKDISLIHNGFFCLLHSTIIHNIRDNIERYKCINSKTMKQWSEELFFREEETRLRKDACHRHIAYICTIKRFLSQCLPLSPLPSLLFFYPCTLPPNPHIQKNHVGDGSPSTHREDR